MKFLFSVLCCLSLSFSSNAQLSPSALAELRRGEDSLKLPALSIVRAPKPVERFTADSVFTRMFVRTLKLPHSFQYPFDSLITISKIYAPDSSFRIFTWQMVLSETVIRQHGAIQMKTDNGELKLFPLIDKSDIIFNPQDTITDNYGWIGAVYYKIIANDKDGKPVYTLLGFDENNIMSNKKIIDILTFDKGQPRFGGPYFSVPNNQLKPTSTARYIMEYKNAAGPRLNYDDELQMIVMEHLVSESNTPNKKSTLVGDGDYEGFKWNNGRWVYVSKIFNEVTPEGQVPVPKPLAADHGVIKPEDNSEAAPQKPKSKKKN